MAKSSKLENLSKEELIKLLNAANAKAELYEKEATRAQKKNAGLIDSYEKKIASANLRFVRSEQEKELYKKKSEDYEIRLANIAALNKERMEIMNELCKRIKKDYVIFDMATLLTIEEQLEAVYEEFGHWLLNASTYRHLLFGKGPDLSHDSVASSEHDESNGQDGTDEGTSGEANTGTDGKNADADGNNTEAGKAQEEGKPSNLLSSSLSAMRRMHRVNKDFFKSVETSDSGDIGACENEVKDIANTEVPDGGKGETKPSRGRQKKDWKPSRNTNPRSKPKDSDLICPHCHKPYKSTAELLHHEMLTAKADLLEIFEYIEAHEPFVVCEGCGHVHVVLNENEDIPIQPDCEIGVKIMLMCCDSLCHGVPLHRIYKQMHDEFGIGHSTLQKALHMFVRNYLSHMDAEFLSHVKEAARLIVDGTPFSVLENQGRGNCMNKKQDRKLNLNEPAPEEIVKGISNYILSACSVPLAEQQFVYYGFLPTRSCKSIEKVLTPDFKTQTIICDAFNGYGTLAKERGLKVQDCLVHFRRYIIRALAPEELADELLEMPDDKRLEYIRGLHKKGDDIMLLYWALEAISKIYSLERSVDQNSPDVLDQIRKVRERERKLIQDLDGIMEEMVTRHMKVKKNGKMQRDRSDVYSSVATYWYNNHENFVTYLDDPMVPPDSNRVERAIRRITILRKNSYHMTSQAGMRDLCTIFTVFESLRKIGVKHPAAFLQPYCRALYNHCVDQWYTRKYYEDGLEGLSKKNVSWNMRALAKDFDFKGCFKELFKDYPKF